MSKSARKTETLFDEVGIFAPHRFIAEDIQWFEKEKQSPSNKPWLDTMWTPLRCRKLRIQDALFKAIEKRPGFRIEKKPDNVLSVELVVSGERLRYSISECVIRSRKPPTKAELRKAAQSGKKARPKIVEMPTGRLYVSARGVYRGVGSGSWSDEEAKPLEDQIETILTGIAGVAAEAAAQRAKDDEETRLAEAKRAERRRSRRIESSRWEALEETMAALERADRLRRFVSRLVEHSPMRPDQERLVKKWARWAKVHIDRIDPMTHGMDGVLAHLKLHKQ